MCRRLRLTPFLATGLVLATSSLHAAELTPEKVAQIRRESEAEMKRIDAAYGNRPSSEMTNEERRAQIAARAEAEARILEKHGVDARTYTHYTLRMNAEERARVEAAEKALAAKEKAEAEKKKAAEGTGEIPIQQGFGENNPVDLEETPDAPPKVEYGTGGASL